MAPLACWGQANHANPASKPNKRTSNKRPRGGIEPSAVGKTETWSRCQPATLEILWLSMLLSWLCWDTSGCLCPPCGAESQSVLSWAIQAVFGCSPGRYVVITCQQPLSGFSLQSANNNVHSSFRLFWRSVEKELLAGDLCVARAAIQGSPVSSPCLASFTYRTPKTV